MELQLDFFGIPKKGDGWRLQETRGPASLISMGVPRRQYIKAMGSLQGRDGTTLLAETHVVGVLPERPNFSIGILQMTKHGDCSLSDLTA